MKHSPNNRMSMGASAALNTLQRVKGKISVELDGTLVPAVLTRGEGGLAPAMGGILSTSSQSILIQKSDYPERPPENCTVQFMDGELASDGPLTATLVVDRDGYWSITCEEAYE